MRKHILEAQHALSNVAKLSTSDKIMQFMQKITIKHYCFLGENWGYPNEAAFKNVYFSV